MLKRRSHWLTAVIGSALLHAAFLGATLVALRIAGASKRAALPERVGRGSAPLPVVLLEGHSARPPGKVEVPSRSMAAFSSARPRQRARARIPEAAPTSPSESALAEAPRQSGGNSESASAASKTAGDTWEDSTVRDSDRSAEGRGASPQSFGPVESGSLGASSSGSDRIAQLHQRLANSARHCYPYAARRLRLRGEVALHFCLDSQGVAEAAALRGTTGSALLDRAALQCVLAGALPAPGIPGCYDIPILFSEQR